MQNILALGRYPLALVSPTGASHLLPKSLLKRSQEGRVRPLEILGSFKSKEGLTPVCTYHILMFPVGHYHPRNRQKGNPFKGICWRTNCIWVKENNVWPSQSYLLWALFPACKNISGGEGHQLLHRKVLCEQFRVYGCTQIIYVYMYVTIMMMILNSYHLAENQASAGCLLCIIF